MTNRSSFKLENKRHACYFATAAWLTKLQELRKKGEKKWRPGAKKTSAFVFVMAALASYICFSFYNVLDIFSNNHNKKFTIKF